MRQILVVLLLLGYILFNMVVPARSQDPTPPAAPGGIITGSIVNLSQGGEVPQKLDVMLHILDQNYAGQGMLHGQSLPDGSFRFEEVPINPEYFYAVMGSYQGMTYYSDPVPFEEEGVLDIKLPIYEGTQDPSLAQVDQLHILFNFAQDGLEVKELYLLSNLGDRTITGTLILEGNQPATFLFPIPQDADYIFFDPNDSDRFKQVTGGFADAAPLAPGEGAGQVGVSYLLPLSEKPSYSYTAPLGIKMITFLLPATAGVTLSGEDLGTPQTSAMGDGQEFLVYSLEDLQPGQSINLEFSGEPKLDAPKKNEPIETKSSFPGLAIGSSVLGIAMIALSIWWWRKSKDDVAEDEEMEDESSDAKLDEVILKIAQLDEFYEQGKMSEAEHQERRKALTREAKARLAEQDVTS